MQLNRIYNEDCLEGMKQMPDNSIDLVVTDPPYKMNHSTGGCTNIGMKNKWQGNIKAGNSIVVNVLEAILGNLLVEERSDWLDK